MNVKPKLLNQVRAKIRLKPYSIRTEQAYVDWIRGMTMTLHPTVAAVTDRIRQRSAPTRSAYLAQLEQARRAGPIRKGLSPKRSGCAVLPVAGAVAEALAPPRPVEVIFPWLQAEARRRDPDHQHPWVLLMDGQPSLWETAAATLGEAPRVEILDLLHATGYLWETVHLFHAPGSDLAQKWMKVLTLGLLSGMGTGVIGWLQHLAEPSELPAATGFTTIGTSPPATPSRRG